MKTFPNFKTTLHFWIVKHPELRKARPIGLVSRLGVGVLSALLLVLAGCGGPKYADHFEDWLGIRLATSQPIKLERVKVEEVSSGKIEAVFLFRGKFSVTRDLYEAVDVAGDLKAAPAIQRLIESGAVQRGEGNPLFSALQKELQVPILRVATPKGQKGDFSGKAKAELNNDGSWSFQILEVEGVTLEGEIPPEGKNWLADGSTEAGEHLANLRNQIAEAYALADSTEKAVEEERKKEEARLLEEKRRAEEERVSLEKKAEEERIRLAAESKKRETVFLAEIAPGCEIVGVWQGGEASGEIGIRFGEQMKMGDGFSIQGQLFDPSESPRAKAFSGMITGDGSPQNPYLLKVRIARIEGPNPDQEEMQRTRNKTAGFLISSSNFGLELKWNPEDGSFAGFVERRDNWLFQNVAGPKDWGVNIPVQFPKGYAPKSASPRD